MRATDRSRLFADVIRAISLVLDLDEGVKLYHAWRVGLLAHRIGRHSLGEGGERLYLAGLLHDIGGIGLRDHILHHAQAGQVSPDAVRHVLEGVRILQPFAPLAWIAPIVADHHERFDGKGYPHGRRGAEIPLSAGIVHLADLLDVVLRAEPPGDRLDRARDLVASARGTACAPEIADAGRRMLEAEPEILETLFDPEALDREVGRFEYLPPELDAVSSEDLLAEMLWLFSRIIDAKHAYTSGHSQRVAHYALAIADALGCDAFNRFDLLWAGLLHDVGKVGVPRRLLERPGPLSPEEQERVRLHAQDTIEIIRTISAVAPLAYPAAAHHEWYDGSGYPRGAAGDAIPLVGRILAYADTYDGLTSDRPHRRRLSHGEAIRQLRAAVGTQLDPSLADAALQALDAAGARPPTLPQDMEEFRRFFGLDPGEGRDAAPGGRPVQRQLVRPVGRGVLLLDIEPWQRATVDLRGRIVTGAESLAQFLGLPVEARFALLLDASSRAAFETMLEAARTEPSGTATRYLFSRTGRPLEVLLADSRGPERGERPPKEPAGEPEVATLFYRAAENRLQSVQQLAVLYRNFISSSEAVCFADPSGRVLDVNRTWLDLSGRPLKDVVGRPLGDLFLVEPPYLPWHPRGALGDGAAEETWSGEVTLRAARGEGPPLELRITVIRDVRGEKVGYVAHGVDIRERRLHEARMHRLNRLLSGLGPDYRDNVQRVVAAAAEALDAVAAWYQRPVQGAESPGEAAEGGDPSRVAEIVSWVHREARASGASAGDPAPVVRASLHRLGGGDSGVVSLREARRRGVLPEGLPLPDMGVLVWQSVRVSAVAPGALVAAFAEERTLGATEHDFLGTLAAALATEEEKRRTTEALQRSEHVLQEKNAALERMNLLKSDLLAVTSHDLKSPVNAMLSFVNLLQDQLPDLGEAEVRHYLERIRAAGDRLLRLIGDLLDVERLEAGLFELRPRATLPDRIVESVVSLHEPLAAEAQVQLRIRREGFCPALRLDADQMERVLSNLVSNALRVSPQGGAVEVVLDATRPDAVWLQVTDEGPGVPEGEREAIFDRYHQVSGPGKKTGSGLGLSIVRGIVSLHGGRVWVENRPEGGACFTVALPRAPLLADRAGASAVRCGIWATDGVAAALAGPFQSAGAEWVVLPGGAFGEDPDCAPQETLTSLDLLLVEEGRLREPERACVDRLRARSAPPLVVAVASAEDAEQTGPQETGGPWRLVPPVLEIEVRQLLREVRLRARRRARASAAGSDATRTRGRP